MSHYSNAQRIAMLGFGAQLQDGVVSHCFSLNGRAHHPRCDGAAAAMLAYETALASVNFSGPTCIAPVINAVVAMNCDVWGSQSVAREYHVMVIVFDTPCRDLQVIFSSAFRCFVCVWFMPNQSDQDTIDAVVNSSFWPISILMASCRPCALVLARLTQPQVGVGTASFAVMQDIFDSDVEPLVSSSGHTACRDNVQFVSLRDFCEQDTVMSRLCRSLFRVRVAAFAIRSGTTRSHASCLQGRACGDSSSGRRVLCLHR
jgi:hypothetical protein